MEIRLSMDYTVQLPLWDEEGLMDGNPPELPTALEAELRAWAANFNAHFSWETGWPSAEMEVAHRLEGERLLVELRAALPLDEVSFHYWETKHQ